MHRFAALALCLTPLPALAQMPPPVMDSVTLQLDAEDWVDTASARVLVSVDAAGAGADAGTVRSSLLEAIRSLVPKAEWRIVRFERATDSAGLERWRALAEARLPDTALGGLSDKARQASRPGLQIRVDAVEFTPTPAEVDTVRTRLRGEIYRKAAAELKALEQVFPGRSFRMGSIDFDDDAMAVRMMRKEAQAMTMAAPAPADAAPLNVSEKLSVSARVVLSAVAPTAPQP